MSEESLRINPDIKIIDYGKRQLKKLTMYPLSVGDQFTVTDIVTKIATELARAQKEGKTSDYLFLTTAMKLIQDNINQLLSLIADVPLEEAGTIINDLTNSQLLEIVDIIWTVNYEPAIKKGQSLLERGKSVFNSSESLQSSSKSTDNID